VIEEVCESAGSVQGSQVEGGIGDDVYVAWEHYPADPLASREIRVRRSSNLGTAFGQTQLVTPVTPIGDGFALQGNFRTFLDLQGLAVDRTRGARPGSVYLTFHDGRNRQQPDPLGNCGGTPTYCFSDVFVTRSNDRGAIQRSAGRPRVRPDPLRLAWLGGRAGGHPAWGWRPPCWRPTSWASGCGTTRCSPSRCSASRHSRVG
jgi:hypothetical protein